MNKTLHSTAQISIVVLTIAALAPTLRAQPVPTKASPDAPLMVFRGNQPGSAAPMPAGMVPVAGTFPPMLAGVITPEEYRKYSEFQQHLSDAPAIQELEAKIRTHIKELQQLRAEANAARELLIAANPEVLAIRAKITAALFAHTGTGPAIIPVPAKK